MRIFLFVCLSLALSACGPRAADENAGCTLSAKQNIAFSTEAETDIIEARAVGPSCAQAVVTLSLRTANGDPLWVFAGTYYDMAYGGVPPEGAAAVSREDMNRFLKSWADVTLGKTSALPAWTEAAASLAAVTESGIAYDTPFDRDTYEMLRARDLPQLCYAAAVEATHCLIIDPISRAPTMIVAYGS